MVFKGLLIVLGGFLFIFSSGIPMRLIAQYRPDYKREGLYWGIGIWIVAFFTSTFLMNLIRQIISGESAATQSGSSAAGILTYLLGAVITTLVMQLGMRIFLKQRQSKGEDAVNYGLAMGFGIGLIAQVFTGMILITTGAGVFFKGAGIVLAGADLRTAMVEMVAAQPLFSILAALAALVLFRVALLTVSAVQGYLVAGSMLGKKSAFWLAAAVYTAFVWVILLLQLALGIENPGQVSLGVTPPWVSVLSACYYLITFILGYRWLTNVLRSAGPKTGSKRR
jgi:hypothetical protein